MNEHRHAAHAAPVEDDPSRFWEERYRESDRIWSGRVNRTTADVAAELPPGRALDLGCGEGADAIWLAGRGWRVTGVDIAVVAVERARALAHEAGLDEQAVRFEAVDLDSWSPPDRYDLVTASFFHSPVQLDRTAILRRCAERVLPGGHLLIVSHAAPPPWSRDASPWRLPSPQEEADELALDPAQWTVRLAEPRERPVTAPDGTAAVLTDGVVLLRRAAQSAGRPG